MNVALLYLAILNATKGLPLHNCTVHSVAYEIRVGSLLSTDFLLWTVSALTDKVYCYKGKTLLGAKAPQEVANKTVKILYAKLPKIKNLEDLRIKGQWYYTMLSSTPFAEAAQRAFKCLDTYEDLRALFCFLELEGYYERYYYGREAVVQMPCLQNVTDPGEAWALASLAKRLRGGNITYALNLLYSYYAYSLYYSKKDVYFIKYMLALLATQACSPKEVALITLCRLGSEKWRECYALLSFYISYEKEKR